MKKPTIGVAMIVKNEEVMLPRCLDSVQTADEIVICDTGSEDKTIEIAKKYTDKIFTDYKWNDHFGEAYTHAFSKATTDWILSIDADGMLEEGGIEKIRDIIEKVHDDDRIDSISYDIWKKNPPQKSHTLKRICRNGTVWKYRVHSNPDVSRPYKSDVKIFAGYSPAHKKDPDRALRMLLKQKEEMPGDARTLYYLAREYVYRGQYQKAIDELKDYFPKAKYLAEKNDAYLMQARCLAELGKFNEACDSAWEAIKYNANFAEALHFIADHMDETNKKRWRSFAELADNTNVMFVRNRPMVRNFKVGENMKLQVVEKEKLPADLNPDCLFYFENLLQRHKRVDVLEWGSGYSTRYFPSLLKSCGIDYTWKAMEHNKAWYKTVSGWDLDNVEVVLADKDSKEYLEPGGRYDLIYIDGRNRAQCLKNAKKLLKPGGIVLLHDAERERYHEAFEGYHWGYIGKDKPKLWHGQLHPLKRIPKIIHQIWIGPNELPKEMKTWKEKNPNFEHKLWTEKEIDKLKLSNRKLYDMYYKAGEFASCSNMARAEILRTEGGVYVDADMKCVNTLEDAPFMLWDFFTIYAVDGATRLNNAPIGCIPGHHYLQEYVDRHRELKPTTEFGYKTNGVGLWTEIVGQDDRVLPAYAFAPKFHTGRKNVPIGLCYAEHSWDSTEKIISGEMKGKLIDIN